MKEHPILFNGPMVRALLDGSKTQTRRIVKSKHLPFLANIVGAFLDGKWNQRPLPYGQPGDRLWVRETWSSDFANHYPCDRVWYRADDDRKHDIEVRDGARGIWSPEHQEFVPFQWRPSIHMPRRASRITLEVTGVRVERLNDCSDADALAEGVDRTNTSISGYAKERYRQLWESINGPGSWAANPWVWVIEFRRVEP